MKLFDDVLNQHNAYRRDRGEFTPQGIQHRQPGILQPVFPWGKVAAITWDDAMVIYPHITKHIDPNDQQVAALIQERAKSSSWFHQTQAAEEVRQKFQAFERTPSFLRAKEDFETMRPDRVAGGWMALLGKLGRNERFPRAEEFWGYALRYANEREGAGTRPPWTDIAIESIKEAIEELPETIQDAASAALSAVDPRKLIPNPRPWADLFLNITYFTIAGIGAYYLFKRMQ